MLTRLIEFGVKVQTEIVFLSPCEINPEISHQKKFRAGDVRVTHQGQCLAFGFEAGDDLFRIHAGFDGFQSDGFIALVS